MYWNYVTIAKNAGVSGRAVYGCSPAEIVGSNPTRGMVVCCECCVLSGTGLCYKLITRPEESYRLWCVVVCDLETSRMRRPWPALGRSATEKRIAEIATRKSFWWSSYLSVNQSIHCVDRLLSLLIYDIQLIIQFVNQKLTSQRINQMCQSQSIHSFS